MTTHKDRTVIYTRSPAITGSIYLRLSFDRHGDEMAVARQKEDALALAMREGLAITDDLVITDNDITAKGTKVRPGFERLMTMIDNGEITHVICYKIDRLTRNPRDMARLLEAGMRHGLIIHETSGGTHDLATSSGRLPFSILSSAAAFENEIKSERMRRKNQATRDAGMVAGGRRSFGYTKGMEIVDHEAKALREAYDALLSGWSIRAIARHWNDQGIKTATGCEWSPSVVTRILKNARNAAILTYQGEEIREGVWPAIVDEATYRSAMLILRDPSRLNRHGAKRLLSGVAICGVCGAKVHGGGTQPSKGTGVYSCTSHKHLARKALPIDVLVRETLLDWMTRDEFRDLVMSGQGDDTADLYAQKRRLNGDLEDVFATMGDSKRLKAAARPTIAKIEAEIDAIDARLANHRTNVALRPLAELFDADDRHAHWEEMPVDVRRMIIETLAEIVIMPVGRGRKRFDPETVVITPKA